MTNLYDRAAAEREVRAALMTIIEPDAIDPWMRGRTPAFDGQSANDLLALGPEGRDRVLALIDAFASGAFL